MRLTGLFHRQTPSRLAGEATASTQSPRRRHSAGQSVVEFAIILPILLSLVGGCLDFARIYFTDLRVQSGARAAAEAIAINKDWSSCPSCAAAHAQELVNQEVTGSPVCTGSNCPVVTITQLSVNPSAPGATAAHPIATVTVHVSQPFDMLFPYPWMSPPGHWDLTHDVTFSVIQQ